MIYIIAFSINTKLRHHDMTIKPEILYVEIFKCWNWSRIDKIEQI